MRPMPAAASGPFPLWHECFGTVQRSRCKFNHAQADREKDGVVAGGMG